MTVCTDLPPDALDDLCGTFAHRGDALHVTDRPHGNCGAMAVRFAEAAADRGWDCQIVGWQATYEDPDDHDVLVDAGLGPMHWVVDITDDTGSVWQVDWTARQYDPDAEHPRIRPAHCCDDCAHPETSKYFWSETDQLTTDEARDEAVDEIRTDDLPAG